MRTSFQSLPPLPRLQEHLRRCQAQVSDAEVWHGELPVPVLDRSWLQLEVINVAALLERFPADSSAHAPELMRFRTLLQQNVPADAAEQQCWDEFGADACHLALRRFWMEQQQPLHLWALEDYLELIERYRDSFHEEPRTMPLLVLPRRGDPQRLQCHWI